MKSHYSNKYSSNGLPVIKSLLLATFAISTSAQAACDKIGAAQLQNNIKQVGSWRDKGRTVDFTWSSSIDDLNKEQKLKMVQAFANTNACIKGIPREINFYLKGKLMEIASPSSGVKLVE